MADLEKPLIHASWACREPPEVPLAPGRSTTPDTRLELREKAETSPRVSQPRISKWRVSELKKLQADGQRDSDGGR